MKNYQRLAINLAVLTFLLTGGVSFANADYYELRDDSGNNTNENREIAILESFEDNDYDTWKKYVGENSNLVKSISKEKFNEFIGIRSLARNGKYEEALSQSEKFENEIEGALEKIIKIKTDKIK